LDHNQRLSDTIINIVITSVARGLMNMANKSILIILLLLCLAANASSQGYMGTVATGTGIVPAITVGKASISTASMGAISSLKNLTGSWTLDLKGRLDRHFDLNMFQKGDMILGSGQMSADQGSQKVVACGTAAGNSLTIFISAIDAQQAFQAILSPSGPSLSGEYEALFADGNSESGTVTGKIALVAGTERATVLGNGTSPSASAGAWTGSLTPGIANMNDGAVLGI
jgi:hypothetical protein